MRLGEEAATCAILFLCLAVPCPRAAQTPVSSQTNTVFAFKFAPRVDYPTEKGPQPILAADFNHDGHLDLITGNRGAASVTVLLGKGDGTFKTAANYTTSPGPACIAKGDFNGDTHLDLVIASFSHEISLLLGNTDGSFQPFRTVGPACFAVASSDFNGDGKLDVAYVRNEGVEILLGNGDATFQKAIRYPVAQNTWNLWCGDLNGDGRADLVLASRDDGLLTVLIGKGDGTFERPLNHQVGLWPFSPIAADFNRDGKLDIAFVNAGPKPEDAAVALLSGNGDGTFKHRSSVKLGSSAWLGFMAAGDVDHDSNPDLIVSLGRIFVFSGNGNGTFRQTANFYIGPGSSGVVLADFNHDDRLDLAVADNIYNRVSVLLNQTVSGGASVLTSPDNQSQLATQKSAIQIQGSTRSPSAGTNEIANRNSKLANPASPDHFNSHHWTTENGLPQNKILCLQQTKDSYLWMGGPDGLTRFDGIHFTHFTPLNTPEMKNSLCRALAETADGSLWVATKQGLLRRKNNQFTHYPMTSPDFDPNLFALGVCRDDTLWIGAYPWVTRFRNEQFLPIPRPKDSPVPGYSRCIVEDAQGQIWFNNPWRFDPSRGIFVEGLGENGLHFPANTVFCDRAGVMWFGDVFGGLARWKDNRLDIFTVEDMESPPQYKNGERAGVGAINAINEDAEGNLWFGATGGLFSFRDGHFSSLEEPRVPVHCLRNDREGNLWVGTDAGLWRLTPKPIRTFTTTDGLIHDNVHSICQDQEDSVWIGTDNGISQWKDGTFESHYSGNYAAEFSILSVLADRAGVVWAAGKEGTFLEWRDGRFVRHPLAGGDVVGLYEDHRGDLWISSWFGWRWRNGAILQEFDRNQGGSPKQPVNTFEDKSGKIWIGTIGGGLCRIQDSKVTVLGKQEGVPGTVCAVLREDESGALWIGSDDGLARYKNGQFVTMRTAQGLPDNLVMCLLEDDSGNYWINCHHGIYRVSKEQLNQCADGRISSVQCVLCGIADGMLSTEPNGPNSPNACKTRDGKMWFPTTKGVCVLDPKQIVRDERPPPVLIEQIRIDGELVFDNGVGRNATEAHAFGSTESRPTDRASQTNTGGASVLTSRSAHSNTSAVNVLTPTPPQLPREIANRKSQIENLKIRAGHGRIFEIRFTANSLTAPEKIRFKFRLEGRDRDWNDLGTERKAFLPNLSPGEYKFRVAACNHHEVWNETGATLAFSIAPYFYQTGIFYGACGLAVVLIGTGVQRYRGRVQRQIFELERQAALASERARIAQDMHDELGASLTKIKLLGELEENQTSAAELRKISGMAHEVIQKMDEIVWTVNPKNDTLDEMIGYISQHAEEFFRETSVRCRLDVPIQVPEIVLSAEMRHNIFLVVKEALNNVLKHAEASEVRLHMAVDASLLRVRIEDNGKGIAAPDPSDSNGNGNAKSRDRNGDGLGNMRKRIGELGGEFRVESRLGTGTTISISVKLRGPRKTRSARKHSP